MRKFLIVAAANANPWLFPPLPTQLYNEPLFTYLTCAEQKCSTKVKKKNGRELLAITSIFHRIEVFQEIGMMNFYW
jgi:hypothetical protein